LGLDGLLASREQRRGYFFFIRFFFLYSSIWRILAQRFVYWKPVIFADSGLGDARIICRLKGLFGIIHRSPVYMDSVLEKRVQAMLKRVEIDGL
jgi:hypothetical protein